MKTAFSAITLIITLLVISFPSAFSWELERPSSYVIISERTENASTNNFASIGLGVLIDEYAVDVPRYGGKDYVALRIAATANTRKAIIYGMTEESYYYWQDECLTHTIDWNQIILGGKWINFENAPEVLDPPFRVRFYGGRGSAAYGQLWISQWGFVSFDDRISGYNFTVSAFPDPAFPNSIVAPFWDEGLRMDSESIIRWGIVFYSGQDCLCISWNDFLYVQSSTRVSFQMLITRAPECISSQIWINYKSIPPNGQPLIGLEDQEGFKGQSYTETISNQTTITFYHLQSRFMEHLRIKLEKGNDNGLVDIEEGHDWIRGYNLQLYGPAEPDPLIRFGRALAGTAVLLISPPTGVVSFCGFMVGAVLLGWDWYDFLAEMLYPAPENLPSNVIIEDDDPQGENPSPKPIDYIQVDVGGGLFSFSDAALGTLVFWIFPDSNNQDNSLKITAEVDYGDPDETFSTSTTLKMVKDIGDTPEDALETPEGTFRGYVGDEDDCDYYKIWAEQDRYIDVMLYPRNYSYSDLTVDLYLYDPTETQRASSTNPTIGGLESISFKANATGWWYIEVRYAPGYYDDLYILVFYTNGLLGDINDDGIVSIKDATLLGIAWLSKIGDDNYDPHCDLNLDGVINIKDATILSQNWMKHV
jgi:hypothetical protein